MIRNKRSVLKGQLANFVRRYDELLKLERLLENRRFVSARQIAVWLGPDVKRRLDLAKKQEKAGVRDKPEAVKRYEIELQRADMMHMNAQKFVSRGKYLNNYRDKLQAHRDECLRLYSLALSSLEQGFREDSRLHIWFDRPLIFGSPQGIRPEFADMPRVRPVNEVRKLSGKRGNWLHLKHELVQQELNSMRPIYLSLQSALEEIESLNWIYPSQALTRMRLNASREMVDNYLKMNSSTQSSEIPDRIAYGSQSARS